MLAGFTRDTTRSLHGAPAATKQQKGESWFPFPRPTSSLSREDWTLPAQQDVAHPRASSKSADDDAPPSFFCPISAELMHDPVTTVDGHCYERTNIVNWFVEHEEKADWMNPPTWDWMGARTEALSDPTTTDNLALRSSIECWEEKHSKQLQRARLTPVMSLAPHKPSDVFSRATQIGVGSFKEVHRATLRLPGGRTPMTVAVLKIRDGSVAAEASILLKLGRHPHFSPFLASGID